VNSHHRVTYSEIAKLAGVSEATVSRVLNGNVRVQADRFQRVNAAIERLGYKKNRAARALASGKSGLIAFVVDEEIVHSGDLLWATVSATASKKLMDSELQTLLLVSSNKTDPGFVSEYLKSGEVDGAILYKPDDEALTVDLHKSGFPVVIAGSDFTNNEILHVDIGDFGAASLATQHLIKRGCTRIATITGGPRMPSAHLHLEGFHCALNEAGYKVPTELIIEGDNSFDSGRAAVAKLLTNSVFVDGIFAANDLMAFGAMAELRAQGKLIPEEVAIVGFGNSFLATVSQPSLTTVEQDFEGMGAAVAELMVKMLKNEEARSLTLQCKLSVRDSA
jgi:DNA-binding LacI/PurR family transcriptional regulator